MFQFHLETVLKHPFTIVVSKMMLVNICTGSVARIAKTSVLTVVVTML